MAWGLLKPTKFGKFWPRGELEGLTDDRNIGWLDRLGREYLSQPIEVQNAWYSYGDKRPGQAAANYPFYVAEKFASERGSWPHSDRANSPPFGKILPHEWPKYYEFKLKCYRPEELGSMVSANQVFMVDRALGELIENFEPGLHQFQKIELIWQEKALEFDFFVIFINQYKDSFSPGQSNPAVFKENGKYGFLLDWGRAGIEGAALDQSAFRGAHLWKERRLCNHGLICLSNELQAAILDAGLQVPHHYRMKEV